MGRVVAPAGAPPPVILDIDIPTAMTEAEALALRELARGKQVLEVGSWYGFSTVLMAQVADLVVAVDWHQGDRHVAPGNTLEPFLANLRRYGVSANVLPVVARWDSGEVMRSLAWAYDLVFLDADHGEEEVLGQLERFGRRAIALAVHDWGVDQEGCGVAAALQRWDSLTPMSMQVVDTLAIFRPIP